MIMFRGTGAASRPSIQAARRNEVKEAKGELREVTGSVRRNSQRSRKRKAHKEGQKEEAFPRSLLEFHDDGKERRGREKKPVRSDFSENYR